MRLSYALHLFVVVFILLSGLVPTLRWPRPLSQSQETVHGELDKERIRSFLVATVSAVL